MDLPEDNLKWFGEGFDGFPKRLPDDCVEYAIYVLESAIQESERRERLREIISAANALTKKLLKDFIWQRDNFRLELVREEGNSFLRGRTNYGDSVDDEWLIVYLLRELSRQFPKAWIKIVDTDGEFLLIEAANALPRWVNPEVADNRVWLNNGQLLIIPISRGTAKSGKQQTSGTSTLTLQQACSCLQGDRSRLLHLPGVEAEAFHRLRNYPKQIEESLHRAVVAIPRSLAYVLHQNAAYISSAVESFYLRDPIALRPLQAQDAEYLVFPPVDFVTTSVKFTKVGYAQFKSQHFPPPALWATAIRGKRDGGFSPEAEMGMKVSGAFEMLVSDPHKQDNKIVREIRLLLEDIRTGEDRLPLDSDISAWGLHQDDETWLDINFQDFENELSGKGKGPTASDKGFGDKSAQENLRKMVSRFEDFLQDDTAPGLEGTEMFDDMDEDDDDEESLVSDSEDNDSSAGEDKEGSFTEDEFTAMMREMMGMPAETMRELMGVSEAQRKASSHKNANPSNASVGAQVAEGVEDADNDEDEEIRALTALMEAELKEAGALQLDVVPTEGVPQRRVAYVKDDGTNATTDGEDLNGDNAEDGIGEGDEPNVDYNLAKNMLESFKNQAGLAGPGGNLLGLMGMKLPRDEPDSRAGND